MRNIKLASIAVIFNDDKSKILGVSRKDDKTKFGLPGGKIDEGEIIYNGMIREVKEETGIIVLSASPIFFREDGDYFVNVYLVNEYEGTINTTEKGVVSWITFDDLKTGAFPEYNKMLEEHLRFINIIS
jgi:8-oxo-dGTP diphosphatase